MEPVTGIIIIFVVTIVAMGFFAFRLLKPAAAKPSQDQTQSK